MSISLTIRAASSIAMTIALVSSVTVQSASARPATPPLDRSEQLNIKVTDSIAKRLEAQVEFVDKESLILDTDSPNKFKMTKAWTSYERRSVLDALGKACSLAPGLLDYATASGKLKLFRISSVPSGREGSSLLAFVLNGTITFTDRFFENRHGTKAILHELIHIADTGCRFSYTKSWIQYAHPIISEMRIRRRVGLQGAADHLDDSTSSSRRPDYFGWSGEGSIPDSFAEFFAQKLVQNKPGASSDEIHFRQKLLSPTASDLEFVRIFNTAANFESKHDIAQARTNYQTASSKEPNCFVAHFAYGQQSYRLNDCDSAEKALSKARVIAQNISLPSGESDFCTLQGLQAKMLANRGEFVQAKTLLDEAIENSSSEGTLFQSRASVNERLGQYGAAAADWWFAENRTYCQDSSVDTVIDTTELLNLSDEAIARKKLSDKKLGMLYLGKARLNQSLGEHTKNESRKRRYFYHALSDLRNGIMYYELNVGRGLFECGLLGIKLGDRDEVAQCQRDLRMSDRNSLAARILDLQLLELDGKTEEAKASYPALKDTILRIVSGKESEKLGSHQSKQN